MDEVFLDATILNGLNSTYIADLFEKWLENPKNVDANWNDWFSDMQNTGSSNDIPSWAKGKSFEEKLENLENKNSSLSSEEMRKASIDSLRAVMMIRAYRARGHLEAKTDPLNLEKKEVRENGQILWRKAKSLILNGNMLVSKNPEIFLPNKYFSSSNPKLEYHYLMLEASIILVLQPLSDLNSDSLLLIHQLDMFDR